MTTITTDKIRETLHPYQRDAVNFIDAHDGTCALWLPMGAGKTLSTLAYLHLRPDIERVLIIAPLRVAEFVWPVEIQKWANAGLFPGMDDDYVLVREPNEERRIELVYSNKRITIINHEMVPWLRRVCWDQEYDQIIVDESSAYKDQKTMRFRALRDFADHDGAKRMLLLSGTPNPTSYQNLWPQYRLIDGGQRLLPVYKRFLNTFFFSSEGRYFLKSRVYPHPTIPLPQGAYTKIYAKPADEAIQSLVEDITMSLPTIPKSEVKQVESTLTFRLPKNGTQALAQIIADYEDQIQQGKVNPDDNGGLTIANAAVFVGKCHQVCNGAVYRDDKSFDVIHDAKLDLLRDVLTDNTETVNDNILLMYQFEHDAKRIMGKLGKEFAIIPFDERKGHIDAWNNKKIKTLLCHPKTMAHGLNLQYGGSTIVWFGLPFSLEQYLQSNARLARPGQTETVRVVRLASDSDVDQTICTRLHHRQNTMEGFIRYFNR